MDDREDFERATERLNAGAQIAEVRPILIERMWEALSRIPSDEKQHPTAMIGAKLDPSLAPSNPEQKLAMMTRYALLNALIEAGVLDEYMKDEALRKKVFTAAALLPCDKNDLHEAVTARNLRQSSPDCRKEEELKQGGYDSDRPKLAAKFIAWMRDYVDR